MSAEESMPTTEMPAPPERRRAMGCHLAAFAGLIPFGHVVAPFLVWQLLKGDSAFVDHHGREAVNFQITATLGICAIAIVAVVLSGAGLLPVRFLPGVIGATVAGVWVLSLWAALAASGGRWIRYPLSFRVL